MKVLIVGGGSAGWITACYMDAYLNGAARQTGTALPVAITLVESAKIGRIGVGEATVPTLTRTLASIGIPERAFLQHADATFKHAIKFQDWAEQGHAFFHPFHRMSQAPQGRDWVGLQWLDGDMAEPFSALVSPQPEMAEAGVAPKSKEHKDYFGALTYAYHMDAEKFADYLKDLGVSRGITHIVGDVTDVERGDGDTIAAVKLEDGIRHEADLFVDCSGFARLLIGQALGVPYESYGDWLLCDRAVAMRIPYTVKQPDRIRPYTLSTALSAGWVWDIGLRDRRGTGYVYSSQFLSDDDAEAELRAFEGPHTEGIDARRLKFQSGRTEAPWRGNCVAIGLSAGFLEPLESTGLFFVERGVEYLCEFFPRFGAMDEAARAYNTKMKDRYTESLDFINLHYCLTRRDDTAFWREVQKPERITPGLKRLLDLWAEKPVSWLDFTDTSQLFTHFSYEFILYGMGWSPAGHNSMGLEALRSSRPMIEDAVRRAKAGLPSHEDLLEAWAPMAERPAGTSGLRAQFESVPGE